MAVVGTAKELSIGREGSRDETGVREYIRVFGVHTNSATDDSNVVLAADGLPAMYSQYITSSTSDLSALVKSLVASQDRATRNFWRVVVTYSTAFETDPFTYEQGPLSEPPDIVYDSEPYDEVLPGMPDAVHGPSSTANGDPVEDLILEKPTNNQTYINWSGGKGIVNSAGWPYNPPPTQPSTRPVIVFTRNETDFTFLKKLQFENTVNYTEWNGLTPRQAWCKSIRSQQYMWEPTGAGFPPVYYHRVEYTFALKMETWDLQLLDFGWFYLKWSADGLASDPPEEPVVSTFSTDDGDPVFGLLDNSDPNKPGRKLAIGEPAQWRRFPTKRWQDFSGLNINLNLNLQNIRTRRRLKVS